MSESNEICRIYSANQAVSSAEIVGYGALDGTRIIVIDFENEDGTTNKIGFTPEVAVELADRIIEEYLTIERKV